MNISGEVANIHMRTQRTSSLQQEQFTHLNKRRQHDFYVAQSLFREYSLSCSHSNSELFGRLFDKSICDGRPFDYSRENWELLEADIHTNFRTLMEHKAFLSTLCKTFMHTKEKDVLV